MKENTGIRLVDANGNITHPVMATQGYQTFLSCRHCGYKIAKNLATKIEEKVGPHA